jgi:hypothetical protein
MTKMTSNQKEIYNLLDELLWKEWDPIGVNDIEDVRDEYQSYTPAIFSFKINGADKVKIGEYLYKIETINMGLQGNKFRCEEIAQKIIDL